MDTNNIGQLLIEKGIKFYSIGKKGIFTLIAGIGLAVLICLIGLLLYGKIYFLSGYSFTIIISTVSLLIIAVGITLLPFFFLGLHYLGLGKICENTEK